MKSLNEIKFKTNINSIILAVYIFIVWAAYIFKNRSSRAIGLFIFLSIALILSLIVSSKIVKAVQKIEINKNNSPELKKRTVFFSFFAISLFVMLLWFWAFFPGAYPIIDVIWQYKQALEGSYNDWHPFWHTIVFYTFPVKLTGKLYSVVLFQMIYFSLLIGYMGMVIYKHSSLKISLISIAYILLNPFTGWMLIYPCKDVGTAITGCLAMIMAMEAYFSREWAKKWWRLVLLGIMLANTTLFRYNAILFTLVLAIALLFILDKKQFFIMFATFIIFVFIIKIPVYKILNVEKPDERVTEMTGLPLTIIGNVVKESPEKLDQETLNFAYSIAPKEDWENFYRCGSFNDLKFQGFDSTRFNKNVIEEAGIVKVFCMAAKCFKVAPENSLDALITLTDVVYSTEYIKGDQDRYIMEFGRINYNIVYKGNVKLASILKNYKNLISNTIFRYFRILGVALLFMIILIVGKSNFKSFEDWKRIFICLPIFAYDFGTMLLLSWDNDSRYFYITFLVVPLVAVIMLRETKTDNSASCKSQ